MKRRSCLLATASLLLPPAARALASPRGQVVLTVDGRVTAHNADGRADFDMAMLAALPQHSFSTHTPWHSGTPRFAGPRLRDVLAAAGAQGQSLQAQALNDYRVEIPLEDSRRFDVILARLMDGAPMPVRDKGPLFLLYPFDSDARLRSPVYYNRSIWQLKALRVS